MLGYRKHLDIMLMLGKLTDMNNTPHEKTGEMHEFTHVFIVWGRLWGVCGTFCNRFLYKKSILESIAKTAPFAPVFAPMPLILIIWEYLLFLQAIAGYEVDFRLSQVLIFRPSAFTNAFNATIC